MKTKRRWGRLTGALLCGTMLAGLLSMTGFAEGTGVEINETNFPDEKFREIVKHYDIDGDNILNSSEIEEVLSIDCEEKEISSLKGIEHFTALDTLYCTGNRLSSLDVSENTALEWLLCDNNQLTNLDVSQNAELQKLCCSDNQLSGLDVSQNTELKSLSCYCNRLSSLNVGRNTMLLTVMCDNNQYTIKVPEDRIFDLSTLPGFDVNKASNWQGGTVDGNQLHVNDGVETVTYEYDCGNNCDVIFSLEVNTFAFDQNDINTDAKQTIADRIHDVLNKIVKRTFLRYFFSSSGK